MEKYIVEFYSQSFEKWIQDKVFIDKTLKQVKQYAKQQTKQSGSKHRIMRVKVKQVYETH